MVIELNDISKTYQPGKQAAVHALKEVNLQVQAGEFISIMGASGSGKSTLLNILGLVDQPTSGQYRLNGVDALALSDSKQSQLRRDEIGFVVQDFALISNESALFNVSLPMLLTNKSMSTARRKAKEMLDRLAIADQQDKKIREMSGGQRQRVAIARALLMNPSVILADEPVGALDQETSTEVMNILATLNREEHVTIILVTHDPSVAAYASRSLRMQDGYLHM